MYNILRNGLLHNSFALGFVAKTQNSSIPVLQFQEFSPFLKELTNNDKEDMLLCQIQVIKRYLGETVKCCHLFYLLRKEESFRVPIIFN